MKISLHKLFETKIFNKYRYIYFVILLKSNSTNWLDEKLIKYK